MKPVGAITDRAKRYRANRVHRLKKRCEECGGRENLGVGHRDGNESNNRPSNLFTQCKSCNGRQAVRDKKAGRGVRTRQYNPRTSAAERAKYEAIADKYIRLIEKKIGARNLVIKGPVNFKTGGHEVEARRYGDRVTMRLAAPETADLLFEFLHECAHVLLGHLWQEGKPDSVKEQEAVEWAAKTMRAEGIATPKSTLAEHTRYARSFMTQNPGATNLAQYVQAAVEHTRKAHDEGGRIIHETPKAKRREFAREIAFRKGYRGNPSEADALYRKFHGRGPDKIYEMQVAGVDPYGGHPELTSLGPLIRFIVGEGVVLGGEFGDEVKEAEWVREISFVPSVARWHEWLEADDRPIAEAKAKLREWKVPDLAAVPNSKQLYVVGGSYAIDADAVGQDPEKDLWDLGNVYLVEYFSQKRFDRFEPINYFHHFSERSHQDWPRLIYDRVHRLLSLAGGDYEVKAAGITN